MCPIVRAATFPSASSVLRYEVTAIFSSFRSHPVAFPCVRHLLRFRSDGLSVLLRMPCYFACVGVIRASRIPWDASVDLELRLLRRMRKLNLHDLLYAEGRMRQLVGEAE